MEAYVASPVVKSFLAGSLSGTCSTILFQPLDLVKTRIQSYSIGGNKSGMLTVLVSVLKNEKVTGLWTGMAPSLTRTVPGIGVYFSSMHWLRTTFGSKDPRPMESVMIGAFARSISGVSMLPFTVVKTRFESGQFNYRSVTHAIFAIYRAEGSRGLYSGLAATLLRDAPFSGIYLMFYTQAKKVVKESTMLQDYSSLPTLYFACGLVAGCLASVVTQPADVIKTHMQINPGKFSKIPHVIVYVYTKEGFSGFLRGIVPRTVRRTLMAALAWTVYESAMQQFGLK